MGYRIRSKPNGNWALTHRADRGKAGVEERTVSLDSGEARQLGFGPGMTKAEAEEALKRTRLDEDIRQRLAQGARAAERARVKRSQASVWLPAEVVSDFEQHILPSITSKPRLWERAKAFVVTLNFAPEEWYRRPKLIWSYFEQRGHAAYTWRQYLKLINAYGAFYCQHYQKVWKDIPRPTPKERVAIQLAYLKRRPSGGVTFPLDETLLKLSTALLPADATNWLRLSLYFGLRPEEVDQILTKPQGNEEWFIQTDDPRVRYVLHVLQHKLLRKGKPKAMCWKAIPCVLTEQSELIGIILKRGARRPTQKELKKLDTRLILRSGRKGFSSLMNMRGYRVTAYDRWLGHVGKDTIALHYEQKEVAYIEPPEKKVA